MRTLALTALLLTLVACGSSANPGGAPSDNAAQNNNSNNNADVDDNTLDVGEDAPEDTGADTTDAAGGAEDADTPDVPTDTSQDVTEDATEDVSEDDVGDTTEDVPPEVGPCEGLTRQGTVTISNAEELAAFSDVRCVEGSVLIERSTLTDIALPNLHTVTEQLWIQQNETLLGLELDGLRVVGDLRINRNFNLTDASLAALTESTDFIGVEDNFGLATLALPSLDTVVVLRILNNRGLLTVALPRLRLVELTLRIEANAFLQSAQLGGLAEIGNELIIVDNEALGAIDLSRISLIGYASASSIEAIHVADNPTLTELTFDRLREVQGTVLLADNDSLTTVGFPELLDAGGLAFESSRALTHVQLPLLEETDALRFTNTGLNDLDLPALETVASLVINNNRELTSVSAPALEEVQTLTLESLDDVTALVLTNLRVETALTLSGYPFADLSAIATISFEPDASLTITSSDALTSLRGLEGLTTVGTLELSDLGNLNDLTGIENLTEAGVLRLEQLPRLNSLAPLAGFERARVSLEIRSVRALDTTWFTSLTTANRLEIRGCDGVSSINLPALTSVGGDFEVVENATLGGLSAGALTRIDDALKVKDNPALSAIIVSSLQTASIDVARNNALNVVDLSGLESGFEIVFSDNPALSTCDLRALEARVGGGFPGGVNLSGNLDDCP